MLLNGTEELEMKVSFSGKQNLPSINHVTFVGSDTGVREYRR
jgi:hypothetical protein